MRGLRGLPGNEPSAERRRAEAGRRRIGPWPPAGSARPAPGAEGPPGPPDQKFDCNPSETAHSDVVKRDTLEWVRWRRSFRLGEKPAYSIAPKVASMST